MILRLKHCIYFMESFKILNLVTTILFSFSEKNSKINFLIYFIEFRFYCFQFCVFNNFILKSSTFVFKLIKLVQTLVNLLISFLAAKSDVSTFVACPKYFLLA